MITLHNTPQCNKKTKQEIINEKLNYKKMKNEFFKAYVIGIVKTKSQGFTPGSTIPVNQVIPCRVALQQSSTPLHLIRKYTNCKQMTKYFINFANKQLLKFYIKILTVY